MGHRAECRAAWAADTRNINTAVKVNEKSDKLKNRGRKNIPAPAIKKALRTGTIRGV
jgi:hypothetical protein